MGTFRLFLCASLVTILNIPALALECSNSGTSPGIAPDDTGDGSATACGDAAIAGGQFATALGRAALASGDFSTAVGRDAHSTGTSSIALGQLAQSSGPSSIALGFFVESTATGAIAQGYSASSNGENSIALGVDASSANFGSTALGHFANSTGSSSTALGRSAFATGSSSLAAGYLSFASALSSVAIGQSAAAAGSYGAAFGYGASASADNALALGFSAAAQATNSTALGAQALANQPNTVILGSATGVNGAAGYANVGMGTSTPVEAVDVERSAAAARIQLTAFTNTGTEAPQFIQRRARGTKASPAAVLNNDNLGLFSFRGYNGSVMGGSRAAITAQAAGNFTVSSTPTRLIFATTPVGSTTPQQVLVITPDGKVQVNGQNLSVPDYVFEDDYELMPLEELRSFIDANGHLPGIASADQVNTQGLDLAGAQMGLLQKVEELTLYTLQQDRRLAEQDRVLDAMHAELETLRAEREGLRELKTQVDRLVTEFAATR